MQRLVLLAIGMKIILNAQATQLPLFSSRWTPAQEQRLGEIMSAPNNANLTHTQLAIIAYQQIPERTPNAIMHRISKIELTIYPPETSYSPETSGDDVTEYYPEIQSGDATDEDLNRSRTINQQKNIIKQRA
jgi:hypothetical protein